MKDRQRKYSRYWGWYAMRTLIFVTRPFNRNDSTSKLRTCSSSVSIGIVYEAKYETMTDLGNNAKILTTLGKNEEN
ncbi:hypothetical protein P5673_019511 [Acropora cervicornis]|uniref:Uncharacterized protein n=1 Tax=Acropora cervicornis TaxID=6130 RepID=A0AAD9QBS0_ACRCE|nr:hypothetical protein P5673_019511 [Acropora cervicornis]